MRWSPACPGSLGHTAAGNGRGKWHAKGLRGTLVTRRSAPTPADASNNTLNTRGVQRAGTVTKSWASPGGKRSKRWSGATGRALPRGTTDPTGGGYKARKRTTGWILPGAERSDVIPQEDWSAAVGYSTRGTCLPQWVQEGSANPRSSSTPNPPEVMKRLAEHLSQLGFKKAREVDLPRNLILQWFMGGKPLPFHKDHVCVEASLKV